MPVEMKDRLPCAPTDVDDDAVVVEPLVPGRLGNEREHLLGLVGRELIDVTERLDMTLGDHEQMRLGLWIDVVERDDTRACADMVALPV